MSMEQLVLDLTNPQSRENALLELSKKRESFPDLAPYLWHSFGTISALLQVRRRRRHAKQTMCGVQHCTVMRRPPLLS